MSKAEEIEMPKSIGDFVINNAKGIQGYYHYSEVCKLLKQYRQIEIDQLKADVERLRKEREWISVEERLPSALKTCWLSNGKEWVGLGCLVDTNDGWHWALSNGVIYKEGNEIVTECESDDLDVVKWIYTPSINQ